MIDLVRDKGVVAIADQMTPKLLAPNAAETRPQHAQAIREMALACSPIAIENALIAMRDRPDQTNFLPSIAVPTLVVVGDGDQITPPAIAEAMGRAIPRSRLAIIRGAGHMSPLEQPSQVNQAIRQAAEAFGTW